MRKAGDKRKFKGHYSYLLYKIKFECSYTGVSKTFIPNIYLTNDKPFNEIDSESFSILKIIEIKPYFSTQTQNCFNVKKE